MSDMRLFSRGFVAAFINEYKNNPCLWKLNTPDYMAHGKKTAAYGRLLQLLRKVEPTADEFAVKRRIMYLRATYRKERRKVLKNYRPDCADADEYKPTLWYYNLLEFLVEQNESNSHETISEDAVKNEFRDPLDIRVISTTPNKLINHTNKIGKNKRDEYDDIGINVAAKLRKLPKSMQIIAEKLISDVIFEARLNRLTATSGITLENAYMDDT